MTHVRARPTTALVTQRANALVVEETMKEAVRKDLESAAFVSFNNLEVRINRCRRIGAI